MRATVVYRDANGKRKTKVVRNASIFAEPNEVIREFIQENRLSPRTYVYFVRQGATTFKWHGSAYDAYNQKQLEEMAREYRYW